MFFDDDESFVVVQDDDGVFYGGGYKINSELLRALDNKDKDGDDNKANEKDDENDDELEKRKHMFVFPAGLALSSSTSSSAAFNRTDGRDYKVQQYDNVRNVDFLPDFSAFCKSTANGEKESHSTTTILDDLNELKKTTPGDPIIQGKQRRKNATTMTKARANKANDKEKALKTTRRKKQKQV